MIKLKIFGKKRVPANDDDENVNVKGVKWADSVSDVRVADAILRECDSKGGKIAIILNALRNNDGAVEPLPDCVFDCFGDDDCDGLEEAWDLIIALKRKKLVHRDGGGVMVVDILTQCYCRERSDEWIVKWLRGVV